MSQVVFLRNWMCSKDNFETIFFFYELFKVIDPWARRITNQKSCCKVYYFCSVLLHFLRCIFDISTWASATCSKSNNFDILIFVNTKCAFALAERSKTFSTCTSSVSVTYDNANFYQNKSPKFILSVFYVLFLVFNDYCFRLSKFSNRLVAFFTKISIRQKRKHQ